MKKHLIHGFVLLLIIFLLIACGPSKKDTKKTDSSESTDYQVEIQPRDEVSPKKKEFRVIMPSELISKEDAELILERVTFEDKNEVDEFVKGESIIIKLGEPSHYSSLYQGEVYVSSSRMYSGYFLEVNLFQNGTLNEEGPLADWEYLEHGGISYYYSELAEYLIDNIDFDEVFDVEGVGEKAFFSRKYLYELDTWKIYTNYKDYMITVSLHSNAYNDERSGEEEIEWKKAKCVETAKLMLERLAAIIDM